MLLLDTFELKTRLLNGFADVGLGGGAGDDEGVGSGSCFAGGDAFHFADRLLAGGLAVVAMHALDSVDNRVGTGGRGDINFLELAEEFHSKRNYDEQY